jgi:hypothetical protein
MIDVAATSCDDDVSSRGEEPDEQNKNKMKNTVIIYEIKNWGDTFQADGYDQDGWAKNDRVAKLANMIMILDKVDLATASRRANQSIKDMDGDVQTACDVIRAELIGQQGKAAK